MKIRYTCGHELDRPIERIVKNNHRNRMIRIEEGKRCPKCGGASYGTA